MNARYVLLLVSFATLFAITMEVPIEGSTLPPALDFAAPRKNASNMSEKDHLEIGNFRVNYSRMLSTDSPENRPTMSSTTRLGYERWLYEYPTSTTRAQRGRLFFQDYPGRPGVASWREISPGTSLLSLKTQQTKTTPKAASALNGSQNISFNFQVALTILCLAFLQFCFCWL